MQNIEFIGNLCSDPELRSTGSGVSVCTMTVAVNRRFPDKDGNKVTDFFRCLAWRGLSESCSRFLSKGKKVYIRGELQARTYEAKDGTTRMSLDVNIETIEFLTPKQQGEAQPKIDKQEDPSAGFTDISSDDIPF